MMTKMSLYSDLWLIGNLEHKRWKQQVNFWCYKLLFFSVDWSTVFENCPIMSHFQFSCQNSISALFYQILKINEFRLHFCKMRLFERFLNIVFVVVISKIPLQGKKKKESRSIFENWRPNATCFFALTKKAETGYSIEGFNWTSWGP